MTKRITFLVVTICCSLFTVAETGNPRQVDVCVYGGSSAGVMAAYSAAKMGKTVLLVEPGNRLGGLTSGGLGYTDIGNKFAISGLALDFYRKVGQHYGGFEQWIFEPSVAENIFKEYIRSAHVPVLYRYRLKEVKKTQRAIEEMVVETADGREGGDITISAKMFIDCSYEGDLMAKAGVSYIVGREANSVYNETYNGVQLLDKHQFTDGIDPYKTPGNPSSGLLWGISNEELAQQGSGDKKVQAYNYRICLTNNPTNRIAITRPENYDSTMFELALRYIEQDHIRDIKFLMNPSRMPNNKTDINNNGPFSTDMIGANYAYPEADYTTRKKILKELELYNKAFLYFLANDTRVPKEIRKQMQEWGYPKDEFADNGHWSPQAYIREARRMVGAYVMTQANCQGKTMVKDGVGVAAYTMDSHNCQRIVIKKNGKAMVKNEGDVQIGGFAPYPIAYRSITPKETECTNLLVPVCLSASHIAYGSIRMEPMFMVLAQSAAVAASQAIDKKTTVQGINVSELQQMLKTNPLLNGTPPDIIVDDANKELVRFSGNWQKQTRGSFGSSMMVAAKSAGATATFSLPIESEGNYKMYMYLPKISDMAQNIKITVFNGVRKTETIMQADKVKVQGQTRGEWVQVGNYPFRKGRQPYVQISNPAKSGALAADAILLIQQPR